MTLPGERRRLEVPRGRRRPGRSFGSSTETCPILMCVLVVLWVMWLACCSRSAHDLRRFFFFGTVSGRAGIVILYCFYSRSGRGARCTCVWRVGRMASHLIYVGRTGTLDVPKETLRAHSRRSIDPCGCLRGAGTIHPRRASYGNYRFLRREAFSLLDCPTETRNFRPPIGVFASALSHQFL